MGINFYRTSNVKGYIKDNEFGQTEIMNLPAVAFLLEAKGQHAIAVMKTVFAAHSRHESTPPTLYPEHFGIRKTRRLLVQAIEVYNDDRTAEWVEFGAHAGGETPVLKYRVFGRAFDSLEIL